MCNTEQNYAPGDSRATTNEQTAQNETRLFSTINKDWQTNFLAEEVLSLPAERELFQLLDHIRGEYESESPIPGISILLSSYLRNASDLALTVDREDINAVTRLIGFLAKLNTTFAEFDATTDYSNVSAINDERIIAIKNGEGLSHE